MGNCCGVQVKDYSPKSSRAPTLHPARNPSSNQNGFIDERESGHVDAAEKVEEATATTPSIPPNLKVFTAAELRSATRNFRPATVVGEGGFGRVYKGWIDRETYKPSKVGVGMPVAVKKSNPDGDQGLEEWQSEVRFLGKFCHPNLVRLVGYCSEDRDFYLVYEYMQKGSLETHLFRKGAEPLSWEKRLKIAIGAARGLAFLHSSEKSVIYRDFKAANILLDGDCNAKLSDFGLARLGPNPEDSHITTRVKGTYGYAAPEYVATGHLYVKSDVYGFGVVLLEILAGMRAFDTKRPRVTQNLVEWAIPSLSSKRKIKKIMDPGLEGQYPLRGACLAAELILQCLENDPKARPSMDEVLATLEEVSAIKDKPVETKGTKRQGQQRGTNYGRSPLHTSHGGFKHGRNNYR